MTIGDLPITFLNEMRKVLAYYTYNNIEKKKMIVKIKCIYPTSQLKKDEVYYAYKDTANSNRYRYNEYPVFKIFLPILGARKYSTHRFDILDCYEISSMDFRFSREWYIK